MIYKCNECGKLYNEEDGAMFSWEILIILSYATFMAFICKNCMPEKRREEFDRLVQLNKSQKRKK